MSEDRELKRIIEKKMREMFKRYIRDKEVKTQHKRITEIIYEVGDKDFNEKVIKRSYEIPVIVDFWAPWCAPCYILSPEIEYVVKSLEGKVLLAKLNVDDNPVTANKYGIMSIPTVALFRNGRVADYFIGAIPREEIFKWIKRNLY